MAHLFQWYYPEGGWGWIILLCAFISQTLAHGLQLGFSFPLGVSIRRRFYLEERRLSENGSNQAIDEDQVIKQPIVAQHIGCLSGLCLGLSLLVSPLVMTFCRKKSTRLTAVVGGLILSLGVLFTSFANQFQQLFFSYGTVTGLGICMIRDSNSAMLGQYFKKKRPLVEMMLACSSGLGHSLISHFIWTAIKSLGWRYGLHLMAGVFFGPFFLGTFYRSASLYHPQRRAIIHLKTQQKKQILERNPISQTNKIKDLKAYKDKSLIFALSATFVASLGIYTPFISLIQNAFDKASSSNESLLRIQMYFGASWILGCLFFGFIVILKPRGCQITKLYLCIFSLIINALCCFLADFVHGESGSIVFVLVYGTFTGGFLYTFKMYAFDLSYSRNFNKIWPMFQALQGLAVMIGLPTLSNNFSGICLVLASIMLILGDRIKQHLRAMKRREKHIEKYHQHMDGKNGGQSLIIHHEVCRRENHSNSSSDEDEELIEEHNFKDSILQMYKDRFKSPEAMKQWQQIEQELKINGHDNDHQQQQLGQVVPLNPLPNEEIDAKKVEVKVQESPGKVTENAHLQVLKQRFPPIRHGSTDEGCYSSTTTSSGGSADSAGAKYKMSAALTQAMVTAAIPVARPSPAAIPGHKSSQAIPEIQASLVRKSGWRKQPSITVIEEVSA